MLDELKAEIQRQVMADVILTIKEMEEIQSNDLTLLSGDTLQAIRSARTDHPEFKATAYACAVADTFIKLNYPGYAIEVKHNIPFIIKSKAGVPSV